MNNLPNFEYVIKRDFHTEPFKRVVVLGESHVAARLWVNVFGCLLEKFQGPPEPKIIIAGIGGNSISPRSPGYAASVRPSAIERFKEDVILHQPDLVVISYGLNDMRAGMPSEDFREDLSFLVSEIKKAINPVIVLTTVYNMSTYALYPPHDKGSVEATQVYNLVIRQVADKHNALLADIWEAEGQAPWVMSVDTVHANELGHTLIGNRIFETLAVYCSGVAHSLRIEPEAAMKHLTEKHRAAMGRNRERVANLDKDN